MKKHFTYKKLYDEYKKENETAQSQYNKNISQKEIDKVIMTAKKESMPVIKRKIIFTILSVIIPILVILSYILFGITILSMNQKITYVLSFPFCFMIIIMSMALPYKVYGFFNNIETSHINKALRENNMPELLDIGDDF